MSINKKKITDLSLKLKLKSTLEAIYAIKKTIKIWTSWIYKKELLKLNIEKKKDKKIGYNGVLLCILDPSFRRNILFSAKLNPGYT